MSLLCFAFFNVAAVHVYSGPSALKSYPDMRLQRRFIIVCVCGGGGGHKGVLSLSLSPSLSLSLVMVVRGLSPEKIFRQVLDVHGDDCNAF